jgi:hypothetical protein
VTRCVREKIAKNITEPFFVKINTLHTLTMDNSCPKIKASVVFFFYKRAKVNSRPFGENSPNLVTLTPDPGGT